MSLPAIQTDEGKLAAREFPASPVHAETRHELAHPDNEFFLKCPRKSESPLAGLCQLVKKGELPPVQVVESLLGAG
jgi:hypothetical protein